MTTTDRTPEVLSFVRCKLSPSQSLKDLLDDYRHAQPFPHLVLDNLFPNQILDSVLEEVPSASSEKWVHQRDQQTIKSTIRSALDLEEHGHAFISMLHSGAFLYFMTEITGIKALLPDPYLAGAGYHVMHEGGKTEVHVDRNTDLYCGLQRRLAMFIYLNKAWQAEFGGQLELWNRDGTRCEKVIEPLFNRTLIFEIEDRNFHAVRPVASGSGVTRKAFAAYFHTIGRGIAPHNTLYAPSIYRDRDGLIRRVARETLPPFIWETLKALKKRHKMRTVTSYH
jgi:Rps23 Pro-64 3,4-dihydroxylase Tpa1-like proline 4-hydroxylase